MRCTAGRSADCWKLPATRSCAANSNGSRARQNSKPINITVEFLASGKPRPTFAKGRITKLGRRTANLVVEAWQDQRDRPIASAVMNVMIKDDPTQAQLGG